MDDIQRALNAWRDSLAPKLELGGLYARNPVAHKWKIPFRCIMLRELLAWRLHDLLQQVVLLAQSSHGLGARIILRSALETLATLVFLNLKIEGVITGKDSFFALSETTSNLLLGSKDKSTDLPAVNILTMLEKCKVRHPGLVNLHVLLCECAHPNYDGVMGGYAKTDYENHITYFENSWTSRWKDEQSEAVRLCIEVFLSEYDVVWPKLFEELEQWIVKNDEKLEAEKGRT